MSRWVRRADARLGRWVERVAFSSDEGGPGPGYDFRVVPDGCVDLVVSVPAVGGEQDGAGAQVFGLKTRALRVPVGAPVERVAVSLRPGAAARLLRVPASELTDREVELRLLWGRAGEVLAREVARASSAEARVRRVERALLERLGDLTRRDAVDEIVRRAWGHLTRTQGRARVRELARRTGVGERRLERVFLDRVGVSPKRLARILRFQGALAALEGGRPQAAVALELGYSDQAHLLRDFRELAGGPPSQVLGPLSDSSNPRL